MKELKKLDNYQSHKIKAFGLVVFTAASLSGFAGVIAIGKLLRAYFDESKNTTNFTRADKIKTYGPFNGPFHAWK